MEDRGKLGSGLRNLVSKWEKHGSEGDIGLGHDQLYQTGVKEDEDWEWMFEFSNMKIVGDLD